MSHRYTAWMSRETFELMSRETFELRAGEHKTFMESTKSMVLLGTSKWFAKIIVKGWKVFFFVTLLACPAAEYLSSMLLSGNCEPPANEYLSVLSNVGQCGRSRSAWRIITGGITPTSSNTVIAVYTPSHMMCKHIKRVFYVSC